MLVVALIAALAVPGSTAAEERLRVIATSLVAADHRAFARAALRAERPFDWSSDGCTRTPLRWARMFAGPCRQHDFAYRNLGGGLRLARDERTRRWVDARFLTELRRVCRTLQRTDRAAACRLRARVMYAVVRLANRRWTQEAATSVPSPRSRSSGSPKSRCRVPLTRLMTIAPSAPHQNVSIENPGTIQSVM